MVFAGLREPEGRGKEKAQALSKLIEQGFAIHLIDLDVQSDESVDRAVKQVLQHTNGELDVLCNTAAYSVFGPLEACPPSQLQQMLDLNVTGALRLYRAVLPVMRKNHRGRIIQVTSGLGRAVLPFTGVYAASAWAQECFAEALAYEVAPFGIDVAILEPAGYREGGQPRKAVGDEARLAEYEAPLLALAEHMAANHHESQSEETPESVAQALVQAVEADHVARRTPIGADAVQLLELRQKLTADEYEAEIRERAGLTHLHL